MRFDENFIKIKKEIISKVSQQKQQQEERMKGIVRNPNFDRLHHFGNWDRFTPGINLDGKKADCPHCGMLMLLDNWPPNYGGGSSFCGEDGSWGDESSGHGKYICLDCNQEVHIHQYEKRQDGEIVEKVETITYDKPLVERNGKLLTKHDVWREDYREEHGEYPQEAYM